MLSNFTFRREKIGEISGEGWKVEVSSVEVKGKKELGYTLSRGDETVVLLLDENSRPKLLSFVRMKRESQGELMKTEVDQTLLDFLNKKVIRNVAELTHEKDKGPSGLRSLDIKLSDVRDLP